MAKIDSDELIHRLIEIRDEPISDSKCHARKYRLGHKSRDRISADIAVIMDMAKKKGR